MKVNDAKALATWALTAKWCVGSGCGGGDEKTKKAHLGELF